MLYTSLKKNNTANPHKELKHCHTQDSFTRVLTSVLIILPTPAFILNGEGEECVFEYRQVGRATSFSNVTISRGKRNNKRERKQDLT